MLTLVIGGSGSGKSEYAERLAMQAGQPRIYVAAMQVFDDEGRRRIARHRAMRAGKGFLTVERPLHLPGLCIEPRASVLLECLSNLAANEVFDPAGAGFSCAEEEILRGIGQLCEKAEQVVVVSNDVFSSGERYEAQTEDYVRLLGRLNCALAVQADRVVEVVSGIPLVQKGGA